MRIGIDLDDTICRTTEMVDNKLKEYAKKKNMDSLEIMNSILLREEFFDCELENVYKDVVVKHDAADVIRRMRNRGNEIYIITGRRKSKVNNVIKITDKWLSKNNIVVDGIFFSAYGETKADVCKREHIDLMIDDDPYNYKMITGNGDRCILFDDREKYNLRKDYLTSWLDIEEYVNNNRE